MKIAIVGLGKMGTLIADISKQRGHTIVTVDPHAATADVRSVDDLPLADIDACIEFSHPDAVLHSISTLVAAGIPLVVGTTGWYDKIESVRSMVEQSKSAFLYASNFSIGVHVFAEILRHATALFNHFEQYDVAGVESHHNQKADSPSGTARTLAEILLDGLTRKEKLVFGSPDRRIEPNELQFSSMRCGSIPGEHEICFDSEVDSIRLTHTARSRTGFALGAVQAAEWLVGKQGFFTIEDLIREAL
jgi:4-hydroxy-tetrahydrodipicolinate reductase